MKTLRSSVCFLILLQLGACTGRPGENSRDLTSEREGLLNAIEKFNTAFQSGDVEVLSAMITSDYIHTNGSAKAIGKSDWVKYLQKRKADIEAGSLTVQDYELTDLEITYHGATAIVTGKVTVTNERLGETQTSAYRVTNVWVNGAGGWKRAAFHDGRINVE